MHIILCVDDRFGMLFNGRRLSRDSALVEDAVKLCKGSKLWVNEYSDGLFSRYGYSVQICDPDFRRMQEQMISALWKTVIRLLTGIKSAASFCTGGTGVILRTLISTPLCCRDGV